MALKTLYLVAMVVDSAVLAAGAFVFIQAQSDEDPVHPDTGAASLSMPLGWIKDMDFGRRAISERPVDASPYSLVYFGGKIIDGGYDPRLYILSADANGDGMSTVVDRELGRISAQYPDERLVTRAATTLFGGAAEWVEMFRTDAVSSPTVRTFQVHLIRSGKEWMLRCVTNDSDLSVEIMKPNLPRSEMADCKESLYSVSVP
jgi:hypothetical protein